MATFVVTGGGGFIGSNIVEALVHKGEVVRVVDNFSTGRRENLSGVRRDIELIETDIRTLPGLERAFKGADCVLHQAALPSVPRSIADPVTTNEVNVAGSLNVLVAARHAGVRRVVFASSSSVYGNTIELPKKEAMTPAPLSPYAVSKLTAELYAGVFFRLYGLEVVILRYFNVFGKHQDPNSEYSAVIPRFCKSILRNESPVIYGNGEQSRDFTHVANVVHANLLACSSADAPGKVMNIAAGEKTSVNTLFASLKAVYHSSVSASYAPERKGDVRDSFADISLAHKYLGYRPVMDFSKGLRETAEHFRSTFSQPS